MTHFKPKNRRSVGGHLLYYQTIIATKLFPRWDDIMGKINPGSFFYSLAVCISKKILGRSLFVIKIDLTDRCNLQCKMCCHDRETKGMPKDVIWEVLGQIDSAPVRLELMGGEPMLCNEICEIITWAKTKTSIREVFLYTNATLITEAKGRALKAAGVDKAIVTLISHDPVKHDVFTGVQGSWKMTMAGIRNLSGAGIKTNTFTPVHSENVNDLSQINNFIVHELGVTPFFYQYVPQQGANDPLKVPAEKWKEVKHCILCDFSKKHRDFFRRTMSIFGSLCLGGRCAFYVKTNGDITPCPFVSDVVLGNILENNIWNILNNRKRKKDFLDFLSVPAKCSACSYKSVCGGGCKAGNKSLLGSYTMQDYRCLGPWTDPISEKDMCDKLPNFF